MVATIESTVSGTRFAMLPRQKGGAAPLLLLFSGVGVETLSVEPYCHVGQLLHEQGWNVVSLDLPCHGSERLAGEPAELSGWAARILAGRDIVEPFQKRVNDVVDDCIAKGAADPARIAAAGTSRGGLMAIQITAGDPRISAVAAFAPVTDLIALSEFRGQEKNPLVQKLALLNAVEKLRNRPVWFMIGNADERVGTDKAEAFARALTQFAVARNESPQVVFQVVPVPGHVSLVDWHIQAATWLQKTVEKLPPEKIR